jgi:hypothetical protein
MGASRPNGQWLRRLFGVGGAFLIWRRESHTRPARNLSRHDVSWPSPRHSNTAVPRSNPCASDLVEDRSEYAGFEHGGEVWLAFAWNGMDLAEPRLCDVPLVLGAQRDLFEVAGVYRSDARRDPTPRARSLGCRDVHSRGEESSGLTVASDQEAVIVRRCVGPRVAALLAERGSCALGVVLSQSSAHEYADCGS